MDVDARSPASLIAWYRAAAERPDGTPAWVALGWACDAAPAVAAVAREAGAALLAEGSDLERAEWLALLLGRDEALLLRLVAEVPAWADHADPLEPPAPLGRRIVAAALSCVDRRAMLDRVAPLVDRFAAWEDWLRAWVTVDPDGRGLVALQAHVLAGRSLATIAGWLGVVYGAEAPQSLAAAARWVNRAEAPVRDRFYRAALAHAAPPHQALLASLRAGDPRALG